MDLATMRTTVRRDLHDEDAANYRWTDDEIDRHIDHAVADVSRAVPLQETAALAIADDDVKEIDISGVTDRVSVDGVEYPIDEDPRRYRRFSLWGDTLTLLIDDEVTKDEVVNMYYGKKHTLNGSSSTLPVYLEDLVATGAAAYATREWAAYAINQANIGGTDVPDQFLDWAKERLAYYHQELKRQSRRSSVSVRQLYTDRDRTAS